MVKEKEILLKETIEFGKKIKAEMNKRNLADLKRDITYFISSKNVYQFIDDITSCLHRNDIAVPDFLVKILLYDKKTINDIVYTLKLSIES